LGSQDPRTIAPGAQAFSAVLDLAERDSFLDGAPF
jgi:hypothetical protein